MSRFTEGDDDYEYADLDRGRWERNARAALKSKRGRKALAEIREALLALPEQRLIEGALCTVGGPGRVPEVTDSEVGAIVAGRKAKGWDDKYNSPGETADWMRDERGELREAIAENTRGQGCGVCVNGALLWHRLVTQQGLTADEAFAALPTVIASDEGDPMAETARIAEAQAGLAYTLAYELAYRNDETYRAMTPEERYTAFLAWIDAQLAEGAAA